MNSMIGPTSDVSLLALASWRPSIVNSAGWPSPEKRRYMLIVESYRATELEAGSAAPSGDGVGSAATRGDGVGSATTRGDGVGSGAAVGADFDSGAAVGDALGDVAVAADVGVEAIRAMSFAEISVDVSACPHARNAIATAATAVAPTAVRLALKPSLVRGGNAGPEIETWKTAGSLGAGPTTLCSSPDRSGSTSRRAGRATGPLWRRGRIIDFSTRSIDQKSLSFT